MNSWTSNSVRVACCLALVGWLVVGGGTLAFGVEPGEPARPAAFDAKGYELLSTKPYLSPDFDQATFDEVWKVWEEPARSQAEKATPEQRRAMAFSRYGLTVAPGDTSGKPQQYVVDAQGNWTMSCLVCHQGKVAGQVVPGLPNSLIALQTLAEEVRTTKIRTGKQLQRMDTASLAIPLGTTNGTTNAVIFGVVLGNNRDADLNVIRNRTPAVVVHHDHDAPPWWNYKKKKNLYSDAFAPKGPRALMQFMLASNGDKKQFEAWEEDFKQVEAWLNSLEAPKYPYAIDQPLAEKGRVAFNNHCADCHGHYGKESDYPNRVVPISEVNTDRVRLEGFSVAHREKYAESWFAHGHAEQTVTNPVGYLAPPLDGIWASAPYFHNGSVPTLWHVLHPSERPQIWSRTEDGYDQQKVGLEITGYEKLPEAIRTNAERRRFFDTSKSGKNAGGHLFPDQLTEPEKQAVLEYLKTL